ncbi:hypothetical protein GCM10010228_73140 [Streptomyces massasporeus]|nr:hypothetical protein GCM10010228_73140 [Streptomyces massasporeus]
MDGTLIPVRDRKVAASSRTYRFSANVQVIIDADTRLVVASARPAPGNKADAHVWRKSGLPAVAAGTTVIADGAYLGTGLIVPHRRRAGRKTNFSVALGASPGRVPGAWNVGVPGWQRPCAGLGGWCPKAS